MPHPISLVGKRFGKLVVVKEAAASVSASGQRRKNWECVCDCGRVETFPGRRLPYCATNTARSDAVYSCSYCRSQRTCAHCGNPFYSEIYRACCSDECHHERRAAQFRAVYHKKIIADPLHNKKRRDKIKLRAMDDPVFAEKLRSYNRKKKAEKRERMIVDPEFREKCLAKNRLYYRSRAQEIQRRKKQRIVERTAEMTPSQLQEWENRQKEYWRVAARKRASNPEWKYIAQKNSRNHRERVAMAKLMAIGEQIVKKSGDTK